jgi:hypothetical protein
MAAARLLLVDTEDLIAGSLLIIRFSSSHKPSLYGFEIDICMQRSIDAKQLISS